MMPRCSFASASARKVFWMMLSGCGGGFGALGCMVSADAVEGAAVDALAFSGGFAGGSLAVMSIAMLLSERFRRCPLASGGDCGGLSVAAAGAVDLDAASRACWISN